MASRHSEARFEDRQNYHRWSDRLHAALCSKTSTTGFLHLPQHVRGRIYKLAIYDHDRSVVFLPRALPRRIDDRWDDDLPGPLDLAFSLPTTTEPGNNQWWEQYGANLTAADDCSAGNWVTVTPEGSGSSQSVNGASYCASFDAGISESSIDEDSFAHVDFMSESEGCSSTDDGADTTLSDSDDDHHSEANPSMSSRILFVNIAASSTIAPPSLCLSGECRDAECEHCAGNGLASDQDESCYQNSEDPFINEQDNDEEHFDPLEITGMLYELREPSILLACKEIREQCLPQYYASNAFSWRFDWLNYKDSLSHFAGWVDHVVKEHTKEMTGMSFQGRHVVEEGVEFDADIDILDSAPFFQVRVAATHDDEASSAISDGLNRQLITALWEMLITNGSRGFLTEKGLKELGKLFVCAMHRDSGSADYPVEPGQSLLDIPNFRSVL
ncbi:hypothetical protein KC332_g3014 [Hortaea werneckii]|nr:hypothetical protein KC350_g14715 [Hortaea werneckii]KAI6843893.1 hypothetical protein KC358_g3768 [Hortaea werneckii]KAI6923682.1 hypothetical protein KC341_g14554 [Hortaea werneckii]KAI6947296.1 hypothetical protein KC348_g2623 [Hortaea werneckii]KAI6979163.1 hypothetical protein KC321_g2492 [Hortaea werneckii]